MCREVGIEIGSDTDSETQYAVYTSASDLTENEKTKIITVYGESRETSTDSDRKKTKDATDSTVSECGSVQKQDSQEVAGKKCLASARKKKTRHERNRIFRRIHIDSSSDNESTENEKRESLQMCQGKNKKNKGDMRKNMKMENMGKNNTSERKVFRRIKVPSTSENESENELKERDMEDRKKQTDKKRKRNKRKISTNIENTGESEKESTDDVKVKKRKKENELKCSRKLKTVTKGKTSTSETTTENGSEEERGNEKSEISNSTSEKKPTYVSQGGEITFKCPDCNFSAKSSGKVYSHMSDIHDNKLFTCDFCKFRTKNKTSMYNHTTRYCRERDRKDKTGEKVKDLKSPICVKNTKGVKVFKCTYCNFSGGSSGVIYSHMNKDHGMEKFVCSYCHFATGNKTSMYNHSTRYCRALKKKKLIAYCHYSSFLLRLCNTFT